MSGGIGLVELEELLIEVLAKGPAFDECGVRLLELVPVQANEDGLDVLDELINPGKV